MSSLRTIAQRPLDLVIGCHRRGPTTTIVRLHVDGRPGLACATLYAHHTDPEGAFCEQIDASVVLDRVGESTLNAALETLAFESGTPTAIYSPNDLAEHAPAILDQ